MDGYGSKNAETAAKKVFDGYIEKSQAQTRKQQAGEFMDLNPILYDNEELFTAWGQTMHAAPALSPEMAFNAIAPTFGVTATKPEDAATKETARQAAAEAAGGIGVTPQEQTDGPAAGTTEYWNLHGFPGDEKSL